MEDEDLTESNKLMQDVASAPLLQDEPRHEEEEGTPAAKQSVAVMWVLKAVAYLMALDFMIVFLTVQQYWASVDGKPALYGLVFSSYSIAQFFFIPLVAEYLDRRNMRGMLVFTVGLNIVGNLIYMGAASANGQSGQALLFGGRFVAGIGAANIIVGPYYIVRHTKDVALRASRLAIYNIFGFVGRVTGPILAFGILEFVPTIRHKGAEMNQYTWPPLITSFDGICVIILIIALLTRKRDPVPAKVSGRKMKGGFEFKADLLKFYFVHTLVLVIFWAWYANIITLAAVQFRFTRYNEDMYWRAYMPVLIGFIIGSYGFKIMMRKKVQPMTAVFIAMFLMIVGYILLLDYARDDNEIYRYWIGSMILTVGFNMESAAVPAIYSKMIDLSGNEKLMARLLGFLTMFTCAGRALGPLWTPAVIQVTRTAENCCVFMDGEMSGDNSCCDIKGVNTLIPILAAGSAFCLISFVGVLYVVRKYYRREPLLGVN